MKKLVVVLNDLEGSGKSIVARTLSHFFKEREISHSLIVSDERDVEEGLADEFWDIEDEVETGQLIAAVDRTDAVILDVASGFARNWAEFCENTELADLLSEMDVEMTLVIPEHRSERCHEEIVDLAELFSDQGDYVIAHLPIEARGSSVEEKWKGGYAAKAVNYLGALEITIPAIGSDLATALESADVTLAQALAQMENLPRFLEVQVTEWREQATLACERSCDYLIPERVDGLVNAM
jgi:hypothetical protein